MEKSNINNSKNEEGKNNKIGSILSLIFSLAFLLFTFYKLNFFSSIGLNALGVSGCYYNESEKDALCINGKEATFMSLKDTKYYITYSSDSMLIEDKYGNYFTTCKKVKDSKNIICGSVELHKK